MKRALVLGGGGSRGAYEIGVWKALRKLHIDFDIVTGTSIGALNGYFFVTGQYEQALQLWENVTVEDVMRNGVNLELSEFQQMLTYRNREQLRRYLKSYIKNKGADIEPFVELLKRYVEPQKIKDSPIPFGVVTVQWPLLKQTNVVLQKVEDDEMVDYLLASSAVFPIFPIHSFKGKSFLDGGYRDTLPIPFAIELGANEIIAVNLYHNVDFHKDYLNMPFVKLIKPSWDLGSLLLFKQDVIRRNLMLGYNDTMKAYGKFVGHRYSFRPTFNYDEAASHMFTQIIKINPKLATKSNNFLKKVMSPKSSTMDYFLRMLEIVAEKLKIDYLKVYEVSELINEVKEAIVVDESTIALCLDTHRLYSKYSIFDPQNLNYYALFKYCFEHNIVLTKAIKKNRDNFKFVSLFAFFRELYFIRED